MADPDDLPCQELVELVTDYLEGTLPPAQVARLEAHLTDCDYCGEYIAQMRLTIRALGHLAEAEVSVDTRARLLAQFRDWKRTMGSASAF